MNRKFVCEKCGELTHVRLHGYHVAERALEGVNFIVKIDDNDEVTVTTEEDWSQNSYLKGLREDYWIKQAQDMAQDKIDDDMEFECPTCGMDCFVEDSQ